MFKCVITFITYSMLSKMFFSFNYQTLDNIHILTVPASATQSHIEFLIFRTRTICLPQQRFQHLEVLQGNGVLHHQGTFQKRLPALKYESS